MAQFPAQGAHQHGDAAQNQSHKGHAGHKGVFAEQVLDGVGETHDAATAAQDDGQQGEKAFLPVGEQA